MFASFWNACPQPNSLLINRLINDRLLDVYAGQLIDCRRDVASTHRYVAQAVDRPAFIALINCLAEYPLQIYNF